MSADTPDRTLSEIVRETGTTDELDDLPTVGGVDEYDPEVVEIDADDEGLDDVAAAEGTTDRLSDVGELDREGDQLVDEAPYSEGRVLRLRYCHCGQQIDDPEALAPHLLTAHEPEDMGLAAVGEGRRRSTEEIFEGQEKPPALKEPKPLHWKRGDGE